MSNQPSKLRRPTEPALKAKLAMLILPALVVAGVWVGIAQADAPRITEGDARAIFQAVDNGGQAILLRSLTNEGSPAVPGKIRLFGVPDGVHYCSLDWHVIAVHVGDLGGYSFVSAELDGFVASYTLDGIPLTSGITAVKRYNPSAALVQFGTDEAYWRGYGTLLPPDALSVGVHVVNLVFSDPSGPMFGVTRTFAIDAGGTGTCA